MNSIEIKKLTKKYKEKVAVDNLDLSIKEGELFALLGQNGAGKTTTIKMLCGFLTPTSGDAIILGNSINKNMNEIKQNLNVSPQETAVAPNLTVRENIKFICEIYNSHENVDKTLEKFGLKSVKKSKAKTLSGGMQRRLSISMALISNPKVLFLDEPTLGLDVRARRDLWKLILELKGKITIILTTHYLEEVESLADRVGIIEKGKLRALGTVSDLKKQTGKKTLEDIFLSLTEEAI